MASSFTVPCPKSSSLLALCGSRPQDPHQLQLSKISFPSTSSKSSRPSFLAGSSSSSLDQSAFLRFQAPNWSQSTTWKVQSQLGDVAIQKSANSIPVSQTKLDVPSLEESNKQEEPDVKSAVTDEASISAFMTQVSELVKLVDSRDIMELQLKQLDCEITIRKKEALPQPPAPTHMVMMQQSTPQAMVPSQFQPSQSFAPASSPPTPSAAAPALPAPAKSNKSSHPPLKCPMAGTFYRAPAPGEPPFVKVGDKVKKGQVICIIEAMKLMNEIEADQSGTLVEIIAEDGKPVSLDTPLFVIEP